MVQRLLQFFYRDFSGVNEAALLLGLFTFASQILGLIRDRIFAQMIGPGRELDIYYAAFKIPDFLFVFIASLVSVTILIPFFIKEKENKKNEQRFISEVMSAFSVVMITISGLVFISMPALVSIIAPGFDQDMLQELVTVSRIMLLSPFFLGLSNILGTVTQAYKKFTVLGLSPILYNAGIILGTVLLYPTFGVSGLAWGVIAGSVLHVGIQIPILIHTGNFPTITRIRWHFMASIARISLPRTLALSLQKINFIMLSAFATLIGTGGVSLFSFAYNLQAVPLALIGMSFSVAAFPTLVELYESRDKIRFTQAFLGPARQIIFWSLPIIILFIVLRAQIVRVIFGTENFTWADTRITAAIFALFTLSVLSQSLTLLLTKGYYAAGKTFKPLVIHALGLGVTGIVLAIIVAITRLSPELLVTLAEFVRVNSTDSLELLLLPFAFSCGIIISNIVMWYDFSKHFLDPASFSIIFRTFRETLLVALTGGLAAYAGLLIGVTLFSINTFWGILAQGVLAGCCGVIVMILLFRAFKNEEFYQLQVTIQSRFWEKRIADLDVVEQKNITPLS
jgi:putative peptidoglycan lipid II flippase